jgi:hypothetical protein
MSALELVFSNALLVIVDIDEHLNWKRGAAALQNTGGL